MLWIIIIQMGGPRETQDLSGKPELLKETGTFGGGPKKKKATRALIYTLCSKRKKSTPVLLVKNTAIRTQ